MPKKMIEIMQKQLLNKKNKGFLSQKAKPPLSKVSNTLINLESLKQLPKRSQ